MTKRDGERIGVEGHLCILNPEAHFKIRIQKPSIWAVIKSVLVEMVLRGVLLAGAFVSFAVALRGAVKFIFEGI